MTLTDNQIKELNEYYYNPSTGLLNEMQLYYVFKPKGYKFKDIHEFYQKQKINQIYKPFDRKKVYYHSIIGKDGDYQADLMFLKQFKSQNNNYEGILTIIDITSRKAFGYPFKTTKSKEIANLFRQFLQDNKEKVKRLTTDNGSEFKGEFSKLMKEKNIKHYMNEPGDHYKMGKIERFNKTLRMKIMKYMKTYKTSRWFDVLPKLLDNYNNSYHSSIKMAPNDVTKDKKEEIIYNEKLKSINADLQQMNYHVGDKVRILKQKNIFDKGVPNYSSQVYEISEIDGYKIYLFGKDGKVKKPYKFWQLQKIDEVNTFSPPKIEEKVKTIKEAKEIAKFKTKQKKEDLHKINEEGQYILHRAIKPTHEKRVIKKPKKYNE